MVKWFKGHNQYYRFVKSETDWPEREFPKFRIKPIFKWFDFWVGLFIDTEKRLVYFFPIPMFGFCIGYQYSNRPCYGSEHVGTDTTKGGIQPDKPWPRK